jgi:iron complex transport system ATP-binding protein
MQYISTDSQLGNIVALTFGDLGKATWAWTSFIFLVFLPVTLYFFYKRWDYNALDTGEDTAKGLGVNTERERIVGMILTSVLSAIIVSFFGIIAFIGLLAPHIARMIIGSDHRYLIPLSSILGAIILIIADGVGQVILYPSVIPVGIITSMLGGPLFIYLLIRRYRNMFFEVNGINFSYRSRHVLENVSFKVKEDDVISILGPNGVGKTTLIKCIGKVLTPNAGSVFIEGVDLHRMSKKDIAKNIGYVAQKSETSRTTVFDSVLLGRKPHFEWDASEKDVRLAGRVLHLLGLDGLSLKYVDEISGGEYQLVQIARVLVQQPRVILLDEPTSSLDLSNQHMIMHLIRNIVKKNHMAAIMVIHDLNLAIRHSDKFVLMKDGVVYATGGHEVITPENIKQVYNVDAFVETVRGIPVVIPI